MLLRLRCRVNIESGVQKSVILDSGFGVVPCFTSPSFSH